MTSLMNNTHPKLNHDTIWTAFVIWGARGSQSEGRGRPLKSVCCNTGYRAKENTGSRSLGVSAKKQYRILRGE